MANRTISEKITWQKQKKKVNNNNKSQEVKKSRFLITVNVVGSPGPIKLVVNEDSLVVEVIDTVLKTYAREERLPILGSNPNNFLLYCANAGIDALNPFESIGSSGGRIFVLFNKQRTQVPKTEIIDHQKGNNSNSNIGWRAWLRRSFAFNILPH